MSGSEVLEQLLKLPLKPCAFLRSSRTLWLEQTVVEILQGHILTRLESYGVIQVMDHPGCE